MSMIHRRSALQAIGTLSATAALALPAVQGQQDAVRSVPAATGGADGADAELLRLSDELDRLFEEWRPLEHKARLCVEDRDRKCERLGIDAATDYDRFFQISHEKGAEAAVSAEVEMLDRIDDVAKQIRSINPATLAGLAVRAKATRFDCLHTAVLHDPSLRSFDDWPDKILVPFFAQFDRFVQDNGNQAAHREPEQPVTRVHRLASQLSYAMDDWMDVLGVDGRPDLWNAIIWPASTKLGITFQNARAHEVGDTRSLN